MIGWLLGHKHSSPDSGQARRDHACAVQKVTDRKHEFDELMRELQREHEARHRRTVSGLVPGEPRRD